MAHIVSIYVTEGKRERYEEAISYFNNHGSLHSTDRKDREAVQIILNLCKMVVDVYDRKEKRGA